MAELRRLVPLGLLFGLLTLTAGCAREVQPKIVKGVDACAACNMVIDQVNQSCGYVLEGEFVPFDSPGCLLRSFEARRKNGAGLPERIYFADYRDGSFHPADSTLFLLTGHVPTVMNARVICFSDSGGAEEAKKYPDEILTDWLGYRTLRGTPDEVVRISLDENGMQPEVVQVDKGDLVLWVVRGHDLRGPLTISIKGYPEVGTVIVPPDGGEVNFRLMALRPGAGFPVLSGETGRPLGMLKVTGAHTLDEQEM